MTVKDMTSVQLFIFQGVHTKTNDNGGTRNSSARKTTKQHTCGYLRARRLENVMDTGGRLNCVAHAYKHIFIVGVLRHLRKSCYHERSTQAVVPEYINDFHRQLP